MRDIVKLGLIICDNYREYFDPEEMAALEASVRLYGILQPILVRPIPGKEQYKLIAGERRWRAAKNVFGEDYDMPVVVMDVGDIDADAIALIENHYRSDPSAMEEAKRAQSQLYRNANDKEETARQLCWSTRMLDRRLELLACTPAVQQALIERRILIGHAELLAGVASTTQDKVLEGIIVQKVPVSVLKKQLAKFARPLAEAIFDTSVCNACVHNSARQSELFDENIGSGHCQNPAHFDELTLQAVEAKAKPLKDEYQVVHVIKLNDGFKPLHLTPTGELGVGEAQYKMCKGCGSFGCAISALPGSYGETTTSLCFDATCNAQKIADNRKAKRGASGKATQHSAATDTKQATSPAASGKNQPKQAPKKPSNQPSQRVLEYRVAQWRKWAANALMSDPIKNRQLLIALALSNHTRDCATEDYTSAATKISGLSRIPQCCFDDAIGQAQTISEGHISQMVQAVAASAAYGLSEPNLHTLLNYLEVAEAAQFQIDKAFLEMFTMNELESIAEEIGLRKLMGERFDIAREKKKEQFITALMSEKKFSYRGTVPNVMRYPRPPIDAAAAKEPESVQPMVNPADEGTQPAKSRKLPMPEMATA